ncbi:hypothetical protein HSBAA_63840 [Vreelandella sulfidaeris]|uniref:Uncharacterized protein n=1 Tax=Vreelandella sulfidaeris TaxID=115553 RepID=A0A455UL50_9GAMM|nr:hypothetical protein HSBAA_63840 [Halomonas sulfidaeris]
MSEGFGGIKDALLLGRQAVFTERFDMASSRLARAQGTNQAMGQVPRYAMELVAFCSVILLILYLLAAYEGNLGSILPVLSVYALAGFKLLPAFQQVYTSISNIRGNLAAFDTLRDDLRASSQTSQKSGSVSLNEKQDNQWRPRQSIQLKDVTFTYPGKEEPALKT